MPRLGGDVVELAPVRPPLHLGSWRAAINNSFVPLQIDEADGVAFRGSLASTVVEDVSVFEIRATPHVVNRTEELIEQVEGRYYKLSLQLAGSALLEQDGREARLRPGDLAIYDTHRPYRLSFPGPNHALVVMFPHEAVDLPRDEVARVTAARFPSDQGLGRVINPFFIELGRNLDQLRGSHASRLVRSALDLLVTMLSQELSRAADGAVSPARSLAREVREYILANLGDPDLTPASIAQAHYISTRHLYTIFSAEGETVSAWIRARRLERIRRDLTDPLHAGHPVSAIAAQWGLHDAAHFSRVFKAEYGQSPSAYRESATARVSVA
ncbi:MAG: helix-turn-helix domain-containing protein [Intrasporangium sp.]|uniref:AraC-like ligand-binding domain-containing protein n=1 Tax=Intrasporangium sp. TaxID=1925024 RepID=UPI0026496C80|nr:helix-turn-helix domain-containing protein [Intrasporangium sp.]MDN5795610.1 helix-turn-helix domain-containing protein [Intrasporangium sp.]